MQVLRREADMDLTKDDLEIEAQAWASICPFPMSPFLMQTSGSLSCHAGAQGRG